MISVDDALLPLGQIDSRTRAFAEYWFSLPKIDLIPHRDAFRPEQVPRLLPNMGIHELVSPNFVKIRLAGSAIERAYGQSLTGRNYLDFVERDRWNTAARAFQLVCEHPAGMVAQLRSITREGHVLTRETIAVPMRNKYNDANLIYFCSGDELEFSYMNKPPDAMKVMKVLRRLYFDIGAGVPEFHE